MVIGVAAIVERGMKRAEADLRLGNDDIARLDLVVEQIVELAHVDELTVGESLPLITTWMPSGAVLKPCGELGSGCSGSFDHAAHRRS